MSGANDLVIVRIPLDALLDNADFAIGRRRIVVGRMDAPFSLRIGNVGGPLGEVDRPFAFEADCAELIDHIYVTTAVTVPGGIIELWCTNPSGVTFP